MVLVFPAARRSTDGAVFWATAVLARLARKSGDFKRLGRMSRAGTAMTNTRTYRFVRRTEPKKPMFAGRELSRQITHSSQTVVSVTLASRAMKMAASLIVQ